MLAEIRLKSPTLTSCLPSDTTPHTVQSEKQVMFLVLNPQGKVIKLNNITNLRQPINSLMYHVTVGEQDKF